MPLWDRPVDTQGSSGIMCHDSATLTSPPAPAGVVAWAPAGLGTDGGERVNRMCRLNQGTQRVDQTLLQMFL